MRQIQSLAVKDLLATAAITVVFSCPSLAQDRTIPGGAPGEASEKDKGWDSPDIVHPTPFGANSRDVNNIDPTIVPFEGEMPGPLGSDSRDVGDPLSGTGPTIYNPDAMLGGDSRSQRPNGFQVGVIMQSPTGELKFVLSKTRPLSLPSRDDPSQPKGTELVDPPVPVGGSYNQPLGYSSRDTDKKKEDDFSFPEDSTGSYNQPLGYGSRSVPDFASTREQLAHMQQMVQALDQQLGEIESLSRSEQAEVPDPTHSSDESDADQRSDRDASVDGPSALSEESRGGWLSRATGGRIVTPEPIRKIAPNGISISLHEQESGLTVLTPPHIDSNGNVWSGTSRSDRSPSHVGRAQKQYINGRLYWVSNYRDSAGSAKPRLVPNQPKPQNSKYGSQYSQQQNYGQQQHYNQQPKLSPAQMRMRFLMEQQRLDSQRLNQQLQKFQQDMNRLQQQWNR